MSALSLSWSRADVLLVDRVPGLLDQAEVGRPVDGRVRGRVAVELPSRAPPADRPRSRPERHHQREPDDRADEPPTGVRDRPPVRPDAWEVPGVREVAPGGSGSVVGWVWIGSVSIGGIGLVRGWTFDTLEAARTAPDDRPARQGCRRVRFRAGKASGEASWRHLPADGGWTRQSLVIHSEIARPVNTTPASATIGLGPLAARARRACPTRRSRRRSSPRPATRSRPPRHRPARPARAWPADPPGRHRRPARTRHTSTGCSRRRSSRMWRCSSRRTGWPTTATARASSSRMDRSGRR